MIQFFIAIFGLTSMAFAQSNNLVLRRWSPVIGLISEPFWFAATVPTGQYGMVCLCIAYTLIFAWGIRVQWGGR